MRNSTPSLPTILALLCGLAVASGVSAQDEERWFQVELSIFSNENPADREAEVWLPPAAPLAYPRNLQRLQEPLDQLMVPALLPVSEASATPPTPPLLWEELPMAARIAATGPFPARPAGDFHLFDFAQDPFLQLPASESSFQQTNRALERAADYRLLFHGLWRQPVKGSAEATPLYIEGGIPYGAQHELQGDLTIRFNEGADRVVIDADLWLSEFSIVGDNTQEWQLPQVPDAMHRGYDEVGLDNGLEYQIRRIYRLLDSRDMRSNEFHYIDHPAMGIIIMVQPYVVPPVPVPESDPIIGTLPDAGIDPSLAPAQ